MTRRALVLGVTAASLAGLAAAALLVRQREEFKPPSLPPDSPLIRDHSPVLGRKDAPVTVVEFFDPACEACRAFHPIVKRILRTYPEQVRIVLRYAAFHQGSDEAVGMLEAARLQNLFEPALEALLESQPAWAAHGRPRLDIAWDAVARIGLDVERARRERMLPGLVARLNQDAADATALGISQTPTFFINGQPLSSFGIEQLLESVASEVRGLD
ncbi:disulfide bond formation protein DsbA [Oceanibaculum pacificum]|uniref:Disulfide bond formation protein DsbA n=1 Tax=Oceanibaculum pacificum TaxID=580166 RepID=A0A154WFW8_9PROT|nr:disulfide bond formation protein DsbA [Oceanibaculum pacificum]